MNTTIQIEIAQRRSIINIKGTPEEVAQALQQTAAQNDTLKSALGILTAAIKSENNECACGKLSKTECQMVCISQFPVKKTAAKEPDLRLKDGVDDGAYADD